MKKKIVIASTLKPVNDVRAFWKLSQSIAKTNKYEVNIIGNVSKKENDDENIKLFPHKILRKQWIRRILIREQILFKIIKLRPSLLIITTHELLNTALIAKLVTNCKVVYDVQENYFLNLKEISSSPIKKLFAQLIRFKERLSRFYIDEYWLAEKCYQSELPFVKHKFTVIENKAIQFYTPQRKTRPLHMLFSGTISKYAGIDLAMKVFEKALENWPDTILHIIGQIHDQKLERHLKSASDKYKGLLLNISSQPISYEEILNAISSANLGIIGYQPTRVNQDKMPTKLYEYSRYRLPYLVQNETRWQEEGTILGGAIGINFRQINLHKVLKLLDDADLLFSTQYPQKATWENEEAKIIDSLNRLNNYP